MGTLQRLELAVTMLAAEIATAFLQQGMTLPPWRTRTAMLFKWAPDKLRELTRLLSRSTVGRTCGHGAGGDDWTICFGHGAAHCGSGDGRDATGT